MTRIASKMILYYQPHYYVIIDFNMFQKKTLIDYVVLSTEGKYMELSQFSPKKINMLGSVSQVFYVPYAKFHA